MGTASINTAHLESTRSAAELGGAGLVLVQAPDFTGFTGQITANAGANAEGAGSRMASLPVPDVSAISPASPRPCRPALGDETEIRASSAATPVYTQSMGEPSPTLRRLAWL